MPHISTSAMSESSIIAHNQAGLNNLQRALRLGSGQFSLIIVRVNYQRLQRILLAALAECPFQTVELAADTSVLRETLGKKTAPDPAAIMVTGFERVQNRESLFKAANLGRDEFLKTFTCPIVLWMSDPVLQEFNQHAPDFKSFAAAPIRFDYPVGALVSSLHRAADALFVDILDSGSETLGVTLLRLPQVRPELRSLVETELPFALADLERQRATIDPDLWASLQFLQGREAHEPGQMELARDCYERSLVHWLQSNAPANQDKQAVLLFHLGVWWRSYAVLQRAIYQAACQQARVYFEETLDIFRQQQRPERTARFIHALAEVLQKLGDWEALAALVEEGIGLHQGDLIRLARDYGYQAEVALAKADWQAAQAFAEQALEQARRATNIVTRQVKGDDNSQVSPPAAVISLRYHQGWYHFLLGQARLQQNSPDAALQDLENARQQTSPSYDLPLYRQILETLRSLYWQKQDYLRAFHLKLEQRQVENLFGLRAFIGASPLQPYHQTPYLEEGDRTALAAEIRASGRQRAVTALVERLTQPRYQLVVIHGQSGVGKSSILKAGLLPALSQATPEGRLTMPVLVSSYRDWTTCLAQALDRAEPPSAAPKATAAVPTLSGESLPIAPLADADKGANSEPSAMALVERLRSHTAAYRQVVLVFDQFEEFFFERPNLEDRLAVYQFLKICLDEPYIKVVLALREDYLHYLLEWDRFADLDVINNDILSKEVRYYLGNFSPADAKAVIQQLTRSAQFYLEEALIDALVSDLAAHRGDVRPIELQVVGAELQRENITTLAEYQQLGPEPKEQLVQKFLDRVIHDCGPENQTLAQAVLYLLSDESGTRPLKTRQEIEESLALAGVMTDPDQLDLVLQILVGSGMVFELPEVAAMRYQLVHDYLADLVQQQNMPGLIEALQEERRRRRLSEDQLRAALQEQARTLAEATRERDRAERAEISALVSVSQSRLLSHDQLGALLAAVKGGRRLKDTDADVGLKLEAVFALWRSLQAIKEKNRLVGHRDWVLGARFSPDGQQFVSVSDDGSAVVWFATGEQQCQLMGHRGSVLDAVFYPKESPSKIFLATASDDRTICFWDAAGQLLRTLTGHEGAINQLAFSPDGQLLASASNDGTVRLWTPAGALVRSLHGHGDWVRSVAFSPDGKQLVSASEDSTVRLWNIDGDLLQTLVGHSGWVLQAVFSPDGALIASGGDDNTVRLWGTDGQLIETFEGHRDWVRGVAFSPSGKTLASASDDQTVRLWTLEGQILQTFRGHRSSVLSVDFSPQGDRLITASDDDTIRLWQLSGQAQPLCEGHRGIVWDVSWGPNQRLVTGGGDDTVRLWDDSGNLLKILGSHRRSVYSVAWSPDGSFVATASADHTAGIWSPAGERVRSFSAHQDAVWSVDVSPNSQYIATASADRTVRLWQRDGTLLQTWTGHEGGVWSVAFSPDGQQLVSAGEDGSVRLWQLGQGLIRTFKGHSGGVWDAVFSPDGQQIASSGSDGSVRLWSLTGQEEQILRGHRDWVRSVTFSPSGEILASAGDDQTPRFWSRRGDLLQTLKGHSGIIWRVDFDREGGLLASASADGTVRIWPLQLDRLLAQACQWLGDYLRHSATLDEADRRIC